MSPKHVVAKQTRLEDRFKIQALHSSTTYYLKYTDHTKEATAKRGNQPRRHLVAYLRTVPHELARTWNHQTLASRCPPCSLPPTSPPPKPPLCYSNQSSARALYQSIIYLELSTRSQLLETNTTRCTDIFNYSSIHPSVRPSIQTMSSKQNIVFYPRILRKPPFSLDAPGYEPVEGETIPRRNPRSVQKLKARPEEGVATTYDIVRRGSEKFGNAKAMGSRRLIKTHNEKKKIKKMVDGQEHEVEKNWTYFELSEYKYLSFVEFERIVLQLGAGLRKLGLNKDDRVHIFAASR